MIEEWEEKIRFSTMLREDKVGEASFSQYIFTLFLILSDINMDRDAGG